MDSPQRLSRGQSLLRTIDLRLGREIETCVHLGQGQIDAGRENRGGGLDAQAWLKRPQARRLPPIDLDRWAILGDQHVLFERLDLAVPLELEAAIVCLRRA